MGSAAVNPAARTPSVAAAAACLRIVLLFCSLLFLENILYTAVQVKFSLVMVVRFRTKNEKVVSDIDQEEGVFWVINILQMMIQNKPVLLQKK